ncbi:adenylate/guanylate cyclase domain-containing protein [Eudoraea chungangensis]|uniref:adenylate/guanylate cyclase domain-containing protein n=1 Tax=Eudoraea chungangensis TaxID=1481905 RepID=UPI0023ECAB34|nr:adenylate/guanylate cyclase domain-containing protein [Eudoraea chungangensis]
MPKRNNSLALSRKAQRNIGRIIPFGIIWLLGGWLQLFIQEAATQNQNLNPSASITVTLEVFVFASITITLVGLLVGTIEVLWLGNLFDKKSFSQKILYKTGFYSFFLTLTILILYPLAASLELDVSIFDKKVWEKFVNFLSSIELASTLVSVAFNLFMSLFYFEISENLGHGILMNFFTGKYHTPKEEQRIFMFLDMKASTTIAESLGHIQYFKLLKAYYEDFSEAIIEYSGEVYQYVGDEVVISWKYKEGINNNNCIKCFYQMKNDLEKKADYYLSNFEVIPTFKAGIHAGRVTTGEIGALKKQIIFTGDVLNTTARIQGLCNSYAVDLLISKTLQEKLEPDPSYELISLGSDFVEGKKEAIALFTIQRTSDKL